MPRALLPVVLVALTPTAPPASAAVPFDPHSFANASEVAVRHLELDLTVDFDARVLTGRATLGLERYGPSDRLVLDTRDLEILAVHRDDAANVPFDLAPPAPVLGRALAIPLAATTRKVFIDYRTGPEAAALQWLEPAQTAGERPFLFTQSQAILARTWVPCQDTPGVRMTYTATVRVPAGLMAVMGAENPTELAADGVYRFRMDQPIPSYLLALAVGELVFRPLGARSGVYAEPAVIERAAWELADTERMIEAAEGLYGPYRWGRYDLIVLPPAFPYGGMENPRLTFATPTLLAGDRSLVSLVAHELAHSWSGNLVTNATWNDFWLNESFTTYLERRIVEALYGVDAADMQAQLSYHEIEELLAESPPPRETWLYGALAGRDPDGTLAPIVYDKGSHLLRALELATGRESFDAFLRGYFDRFAFQPMTTASFLDYLEVQLLAARPEVAEKVGVEAWVYGPGLPGGAVPVHAAGFDQVDAELARWLAGTPAQDLATAGWVTQQWLHFLGALPQLEALRLAGLDGVFHLTDSGNAEIFAAWAERAIRAGYSPIFPALERFLLTVGRRKFLRPLYEELAKTPEGLAWARHLYGRARPGYHAVSRAAVDGVLGLTAEGS
jgi:aminopeptidase N